MKKFARKTTVLAPRKSSDHGTEPSTRTTPATNLKHSQPSTSTTTAPSETRVADDLLCPLTLELPFVPVTAEDGHVYEQSAIRKHFQTRRDQNLPLTSPLTNQRMGDRLLAAPRVKSLIETLIHERVLTGELADAWKKTAKQHKDKQKWLNRRL